MPEAVHKAWAAGGADRAKLVKLFQDAGLDKESGCILGDM